MLGQQEVEGTRGFRQMSWFLLGAEVLLTAALPGEFPKQALPFWSPALGGSLLVEEEEEVSSRQQFTPTASEAVGRTGDRGDRGSGFLSHSTYAASAQGPSRASPQCPAQPVPPCLLRKADPWGKQAGRLTIGCCLNRMGQLQGCTEHHGDHTPHPQGFWLSGCSGQ